MGARRAVAATVVAALALAVAGCGDDDGGSAADAATLAPAPDAAAPEGFVAATCDLAEDDGPVVALQVPAGVADAAPGGEDCRFTGDVDGASVELWMRTGRRSYADERYEDLKEYEDIGGDENAEDVEIEPDVPVFGETPGDIVSHHFYNDGDPMYEFLGVAGGLLVTFYVPEALGQDRARELFDQVRATIGTA